MNLSKYEKETVINFNEEEESANVYTYNKALIKKLDKLCGNSAAEVIRQCSTGSKTYNIPKNWVKIAPPKKIKVSEERRKALIETAKANFRSGK